MKTYCVKKQNESGNFHCDLVDMHVDNTFCKEICQGRYKRIKGGDYPTTRQMVRSAGKAARRAVKGGFLTRTKEETIRIQKICKECDRYKDGRCDLCGCFLKAKWKLATEHCPIGKWKPVKKKSIIHPKYHHKIFQRADGQPVNLIDIYKGRACFILSNGPSGKLKPPEYFKRPGIVTFGINNGGHYWRPDIVSLQDSTHRFNRSLWLDGRITKLVPMQNRGGQFYGLDGHSGGHIKYCPNVVFHGRSSGMQVDRWLDMDSVCWGDGRDSRNSFIAVIHLCYLLGFTRIYLWGCDFKMNKEKPYFFSESKNAGSVIRNNRMFGHTNEMLTAARPYIEAHGVSIYNCTPDSGLTAFDYMPIDKAVKKEQLEVRDDCKGLYHRGRPSPRPTLIEPKGNLKQNYTVVAYYSKGTPYRYEAERLRGSLQNLGMDYYIRPVRVWGWYKATNYKPTFLLETLKKLKRPILYVDADAIFHRFPECDYNGDIAVWWACKNRNELRSGTIWLDYSDAAFEILEKWQEQCKKYPQKWDQTNLRDVLVKGDWKVIKLPDSMCKIFDRQHNCKDPYIEHFQASRRLKS